MVSMPRFPAKVSERGWMSKQRNFIAAMMVVAGLGPPAMGQDADTVVATVDGTDITVGHMIAARRTLQEQYPNLPPDEVLFEGMLDQMVRQTVLSQSLEDNALALARLSAENATRAILAAAAERSVIADAVTDEAIQAAYEDTYANAVPESEYNASHILVETEDEARDLIDRLDDGADFAELAREHSTGPSGPNGGNLGWFGPGAMVPPFEEAVVALQVGAISVPVDTRFGWPVVLLTDRRERPVPTPDEAREQISEAIGRRVVQERVRLLMEEARFTSAAEGIVDPPSLPASALLAI